MNISNIPLERSYPPIGYGDTLSFKNGKCVSKHGNQTIFKDSEILQVHPSVSEYTLKNVGHDASLVVRINEFSRNVLQQQASRGCSEGVTAMLLMDHHKEISILDMIDCNLGRDEDMMRTFKKVGLTPISSTAPRGNKTKQFEWLSEAIEINGSAIVTLDVNLGGHVVVIDSALKTKLGGVRLRDPYHGWDISVKRRSFLKYWAPVSPIIQISK